MKQNNLIKIAQDTGRVVLIRKGIPVGIVKKDFAYQGLKN